MTEQEIYQAALEHYGTVRQVDKLIEEMGELTQALMKFRHGPTVQRSDHIHEEFVDVMVVMEQIRLTLKARLLEEWKVNKLARLEERITKGTKD